MPTRKEWSLKSKYWMPAEDLATARHYAKRYPSWIAELKEIGGISGLSYDREAVQTSGNSDPTAKQAMRRKELGDKIALIEQTVAEADVSIYTYLLEGVTKGTQWEILAAKGMPCGKNYYNEKRRKFYYLLAKKI